MSKRVWQPIATAPKDGSDVDLWVGGERIPEARWERGRWSVWGLSQYDCMGWVVVQGKPTHWMPLPGPPEADQ